MDKRTLTALQGSIKKWEGIVAGTVEDHGATNCALCAAFPECHGCPVMERTGHADCDESPYYDYTEALYTVGKEGAKKAAQAELDFLKSLLPVAP